MTSEELTRIIQEIIKRRNVQMIVQVICSTNENCAGGQRYCLTCKLSFCLYHYGAGNQTRCGDCISKIMIDYKEADLGRNTARDAHRGTSFSPDERGDQEIAGYMSEMKAVSERFAPFVTPENEVPMKAALEQYRQGYLKRLNARLAAKANCLSTMIAGPSGFNHQRNKKANDTEHRRTAELLEWREKALARLNRDYNPVAIARRPIRSDEPDAVEQLQAKIAKAEGNHRLMKAINRIVGNKKLDDNQKTAKIEELGVSDELLASLKRYGGKFPGFSLTNSNAGIRQTKARIVSLEAEAAQPEVEDLEAAINGTPVTVIENRDEGRLQLIFDGKPPKDVIDLLKANAFKWSRTNEAWQRMLNDNSRRVVRSLIDDTNSVL